MAEKTPADPHTWEGAVALVTGFVGPTREEVGKIPGSSEIPWLKVNISKSSPSTSHTLTLKYCDEPDGAWSVTLLEPTYKYITVDFPFSGATRGQDFSNGGIAGVYDWGYGNALGKLKNAPYTTKGFSVGLDYIVDDTAAVDLTSFEKTARAFDRAGEFFRTHADTLAAWSKSLGEPESAWRGNAAGMFAHLIDELDTAYQSYQKQLEPTGWTTTNHSVTDASYSSLTVQGDGLIRAQIALHTCVETLQTAWDKWIKADKATVASTLPDGTAGTSGAHYLPTNTTTVLLNEIVDWVNANNTGKIQYGTFVTTGDSTFKSTTTWGKLSDMATWKAIADEAVNRWKLNIKAQLDAQVLIALSALNDAWKEISDGSSVTGGGFNPGVIHTLTQDLADDVTKGNLDDKKDPDGNDTKDKDGSGGAGDKDDPGGKGGHIPPNQVTPHIKPPGGPGQTIKNPDGSTSTRNPDGSTTTHNPDGSVTVRKPDGSQITTERNGQTHAGGPNVLLPPPPPQSHIPPGSDPRNPLNPGGGGPRTVRNPDGSQTTYNPADGSRSTKFPDGTTTTIAKDGTTTTVNPDGATTVLHKDGSETVTYPDGTRTTITKDGTSTTHYQDGSSTTHTKDGKLVTTDASGHSTVTRPPPGTVVHNPDGGTTTYNADGSTTSTHINGTKTTIDPKGIVTTTDPDGTRTVSDLQHGTSTIRYADGSTAEVGQDGRVTTHHKDGSSTVLAQDGTLTTKDPSGHSTTTHLGATDDGSAGNPGGPTVRHGNDGSTTTTYSDGTVTKKLADGTVTTTYRDGSTYTTAPDGRVTTTPSSATRLLQESMHRSGPLNTPIPLGSSHPPPGLGGGSGLSSRPAGAPGETAGGPAVRTTSTRASGSALAAAEEAAALKAGARPATTSGSGMPMMPPGGGGGGAPGAGTQSDERERVTWLAADEDVWGTDEGGAPAVIGR